MVNIMKRKFRINPVLLKELKVKMRGKKAVFLIGCYNLALTLLTLFIMKTTMMNGGYGSRITAQNIFGTYAFMAVMQFGLITLIAPALTAGAISGEREKQTLDILMSTTMRHGSIIIGKLFASLSHIILLIVSSVPIFSIIFLYGVIGTKELLQIFLFYIVTAITLGSIGLFMSTFIKKSTASNVLSYAVILFLYLGTLFITIFYEQTVVMPRYIATGMAYPTNTFWLMYCNPAAGLMSLLSTQIGQGGAMFPGVYISGGQSGTQIWIINIIISLVLSAVLLFFSALKLNPAGRKLFRKNRDMEIIDRFLEDDK
ncbi:MAG: ABC transporter permease subunit [Bacillota bacterium]|nr:ABC transporter permease subunit [Bacillota bacterium]